MKDRDNQDRQYRYRGLVYRGVPVCNRGIEVVQLYKNLAGGGSDLLYIVPADDVEPVA